MTEKNWWDGLFTFGEEERDAAWFEDQPVVGRAAPPAPGTPRRPVIPQPEAAPGEDTYQPDVPFDPRALPQAPDRVGLAGVMGAPLPPVEPRPDPVPLTDLGSRVARGATEIGASVPESLAIAAAGAGAGNPNTSALFAQEEVLRAQEQIAAAEARLSANPDMSDEDRARIAAVIGEERAKIEAYQPLVDIAEGSLTGPPASERPLYQRGEAIRQASQELFGTPDPQFDDRFIAKLAEGAGSFAGFVGATLLTGPIGGAAAGASVNSSGMYRRALADGASEEQARAAAYIGSVVGLSEAVPIANALRMLPAPLRDKATSALGRRLSNAFVTAGEEGLQEAMVGVFNNLTEKGIWNPEQSVWENTGEDALIGAILGGALGAAAPTGVSSPGPTTPRGPDEEPPQETAALAPPPAPAPAPLTAEDRASPVPDQPIAEGRAIIDEIVRDNATVSPAQPEAGIAPLPGINDIRTPRTEPSRTGATELPPLPPSPPPVSGQAPEQAVTRPAERPAQPDIPEGAVPADEVFGDAPQQSPRPAARPAQAAPEPATDGRYIEMPDEAGNPGRFDTQTARWEPLPAATTQEPDAATTEDVQPQTQEPVARPVSPAVGDDAGPAQVVPTREDRADLTQGGAAVTATAQAGQQAVPGPGQQTEPKSVGRDRLLKRPLANLMREFGVKPGSPLAKELNARGITARTHPGMFKASGRSDWDNLPVADFEADMVAAIGEDGNGYLSQEGLISALDNEMRGAPIRWGDQVRVEQAQLAKEEKAELEERMMSVLDEYGMADLLTPEERAEMTARTVERGDDPESVLNELIRRSADLGETSNDSEYDALEAEWRWVEWPGYDFGRSTEPPSEVQPRSGERDGGREAEGRGPARESDAGEGDGGTRGARRAGTGRQSRDLFDVGGDQQQAGERQTDLEDLIDEANERDARASQQDPAGGDGETEAPAAATRDRDTPRRDGVDAAPEGAERPAEGAEEEVVPTFAEFRDALPKDGNGDPDLAGRGKAVLEQVGGEGAVWSRLSDEEKQNAMEALRRPAEASAPAARDEAPSDEPRGGARFAVRRQRAETLGPSEDIGPRLYVVHNLSAENLRNVLDLGGSLAAPSLAIARADIGFDSFGEISLIGGPSMADPRERGVKAFNADVYSPRQPRAQYDINGPAFKRMMDVLGPAAELIQKSPQGNIDPDRVSREGLAALEHEEVVQMAYLMEIGQAPRVRLKEPEKIPVRMRKWRGKRHWEIMQDSAFAKAVAAELEAEIQALPEDLRAPVRGRKFNDDGTPAYGILNNRAAMLAEARGGRKVDRFETDRAIRKRMDETRRRRADFREWISDNFGDVLGAKFFRTDSGRRKPYEIDALVREMTRTIRDGEGWNYGVGSIRSMVAAQFKSLSGVKKARGQIVDAEAMRTLKDEANDELVALSEKFAPYHASGQDFGWLDIFSEFLKDLSRGRVREWQTQIFNSPVPSELLTEARVYLEKLRDMPTEYFEVKMQRAVDLSEFEAALVPSKAPADVVQALRDKGLKIIRYGDGPNARGEAAQRVPQAMFAVTRDTPAYQAMRMDQDEMERIRASLNGSQPAEQTRAAFEVFKRAGRSRAAMADAIAAEPGGIELSNGRGILAVISPSLNPRYSWRVTQFDERGPLGHQEYNSKREAAQAALDEGYRELATGELRRMSRGAEFRAAISRGRRPSPQDVGMDPRDTGSLAGGRVLYETTPRFRGEARRVAGDMRTELRKLNLPNIEVRVAERAFGVLSDGTLASIDGVQLRDLILIALDSGRSAASALRHEVVHALRNPNLWGKETGLFRPAEWRALERAALADTEAMAESARDYPGESREVHIEETIARMYEAWSEGRMEATGFVAAGMRAIRNAIEAIGNALRGNGFTTADSVFSAIERGDVGARQGQAAPARRSRIARGGVSMAVRGDDPRFAVRMDSIFFSPLLRAIEGAKQKQAPAKDWKAIIAKLPGVKKAEVDWLGVEDWLDSQEGTQVPREALAEFVRASQVELVEERLAGEEADVPSYSIDVESDNYVEPDWEAEAEIYLDEAESDLRDEAEADGDDPDDISAADIQERAEEMARERWEPTEFRATLYPDDDGAPTYEGWFNSEEQTYYFEGLGDFDSSADAKSAAVDAWQDEGAEGADGPARFESYTEDGGTNYREVLLRVPNLHETGKNSGWVRGEDGRRQIDPVDKRPFVQSAHFDAENIVVHARLKDRQGANGENVLFVEEIQSDLASQWREATESPEVTARRRELEAEERQALEDYDAARGAVWLALAKFQRETNNSVWVFAPAGNDYPLRVPDNTNAGMVRSYFGESNAPLQRVLSEDQYAARLRDGDGMGANPQEAVAIAVARSAELRSIVAEFRRLDIKRDDLRNEIMALGTERTMDPSVPDTPFKEEHTYTLMVKRLLREAAEKGYDKLSWTPGYMQAERWDKAAQSVVEEVEWRAENEMGRPFFLEMSRGNQIAGFYDSLGRISGTRNAGLDGKTLRELVGPSLAKRMLDEPSGTVSGQKITFPDSGYAIAYDQQIRKAVDKFAKRYGGRVYEDRTLPDMASGEVSPRPDLGRPADVSKASDWVDVRNPVWSIDITPEMRDAALEPMPMFAVRRTLKPSAAENIASQTNTPHIPNRRLHTSLLGFNRQFLRQGVKGAASDALDRIRIWGQDQFLAVRRAEEAIERLYGTSIPKSQSAYYAEERYSGRVGRRLEAIDERYARPIIKLIAKQATPFKLTDKDGNAREGYEAVNLFLWARHALERNRQIASINNQMQDGGSGLTDAEANAILAEARNLPNYRDLERIGKLTDRLGREMIDLRKEAGLLSAQEALIWRTQYKHYVPLKGFAETDMYDAIVNENTVPRGRKFNVRGKEDRQALGRSTEAFDPLATLLTQAQEVSIRAEKNHVAKILHNLVSNNPAPAMWEVKAPQTERYFNRATGRVETRVVGPLAGQLGPNEMALKIDGKEHRIVLHDPRLARALGKLGTSGMEDASLAMRAVQRFGQWFSMANTMLNPEFVITNAFRDMQTAQINLRGFVGKQDISAISKAAIKTWPKALMGSYRAMSGKRGSQWAQHFRDYEAAGGKVSFWRIDTPEAGGLDLQRRIRLESGGRGARALKKATALSIRDNALLNWMDRANLAVDNAVRLAVFVEARNRGWSKEDAASLAKNLTVNFNRKGEAGSALNSFYVFFNAAVQGNMTMLRAMKNNPKKMGAIVGGIVMSGLLADLLNAWQSEEDDDGELEYDKIAHWKMERNIIVPDVFGLGDGDDFGTIPMPWGYNVFHYAGVQMGKVARGVKSPSAAFSDVARATFAAFSPISDQDWARTIAPTIGDLGLDLVLNEDWTGKPIRPEPAYADYGPQAFREWNATEAAKVISRTANYVTGGSMVESGAIDVSPEYIDHVVAFLGGGAVRFGQRVADLGAKAATGQVADVETYQVPFARVLVTETADFLDRNRYYTFREVVNSARAMDKRADENDTTIAAVARKPERMEAALGLYDDLRRAEKRRRELDDKLDAIYADDTLSARERAEKLRPVQDKLHEVYMDFNAKFIEAMGPQAE